MNKSTSKQIKELQHKLMLAETNVERLQIIVNNDKDLKQKFYETRKENMELIARIDFMKNNGSSENKMNKFYKDFYDTIVSTVKLSENV